MKYLVTGGAGFIGSNLVEELLKRGNSVRVLDNFSTGKRENLKEFENDIEVFEGDIRSYHTVNQAVKGVEVILHQAALPSVPRSINDPITSNDVNVGGTINLLDAARDHSVRRIIFASSSSVYGDNPKLPKTEDMLPNPLSPYAVSKLAGEKYCQVYSRLYDIETLALRYFNVFGPKQDPNSQYSAVIPKFIMAMNSNKQPVIFGDGLQSRDFTYVANVVEANILAAETSMNSGAVINCATHGQITLKELVDKININFGKNIKPLFLEARAGDIKHSYASIEKIRAALKYSPVVMFDEGLDKTIRYYCN